MTSLEKIAIACATECERQHVGVKELGYLLNAYSFALQASKIYLPGFSGIMDVSLLVEPQKGGLRRVPVTFANSRSGALPENLESALIRLFDYVDSADPKEFTRMYLSIHPHEDGNGRTAFILFNWLNKTLDAPLPLPDFDWDK